MIADKNTAMAGLSLAKVDHIKVNDRNAKFTNARFVICFAVLGDEGVVQPVGSLFSRPCNSAGGVVASSAVNASRIL
jgi:hypothetical protein